MSTSITAAQVVADPARVADVDPAGLPALFQPGRHPEVHRAAPRPMTERQREFSRRAAAALAEGGAFRVEGRLEIADGGRVFVPVRWCFGDVALEAGEALALDPQHWPVGTKLVIVPPGWEPPIRAWWSYSEVGFMLKRAPRTIANLVSGHKLARRTYWDARGVHRRRVTELPPSTVRRLAELTGRAHWITGTDRQNS